MGNANTCYECFYYVDNGVELFGTNPNCINNESIKCEMFSVMDGEKECNLFKVI